MANNRIDTYESIDPAPSEQVFVPSTGSAIGTKRALDTTIIGSPEVGLPNEQPYHKLECILGLLLEEQKKTNLYLSEIYGEEL